MASQDGMTYQRVDSVDPLAHTYRVTEEDGTFLGTARKNPAAAPEFRWTAYSPDGEWLGDTFTRADVGQCLRQQSFSRKDTP